MSNEEWLDELSSVVNSKGKGFCDKVAPGELFSPCSLHSNPSLMCGNCRFTLVMFHDADRLIRLARKGLAAEGIFARWNREKVRKLVEIMDALDLRFGYEDSEIQSDIRAIGEALAACEAATKEECRHET